MPKIDKGTRHFNIVIKKGIESLASTNATSKERRRFTDIYTTVYHHARKKGQTHKQALDYCWNVYSNQAPASAKKIIKNVVRLKMRLDKKSLRQMIIKEMLEGDVVNISDFRKSRPDVVVEPTEESKSYEGLLSEIHDQITEFMSSDFASLTPEQSIFLDNIADMLEEELGIDEEEGIDFDADEDFEDDYEDDL